MKLRISAHFFHCLRTLFDPDDKQESQENILQQRHPSHFLHLLTTSVIINDKMFRFQKNEKIMHVLDRNKRATNIQGLHGRLEIFF